ncbi:tripartite tricarboxylate transporter TctB family protein [Neorhizobium lilium]|uniref:Tripartite tricarboxylate transporter TctB family protein n=1 Tax=Neorhizobium lilium TaxID=2503024 RepID=A0A444LAQ7_9HYPH|nr:tripartite tricarboxylate transporter TctB family protein [Neorhizobium lilium]RWX74708.1 tripartite tricarboxylate transporter TctB family protein [Neorhizobium lilium]
MDTTEKRSRHDVIAGGIFIVIAIFFAAEGSRYELGTGLQMGPGFFPVVLAALLAVFGIFVVVGGFRKPPEASAATPPWRAIILICLSLVLFAAGARTIGLVPLVFLCTVLTALASPKNSPLSACVMGLVMTTLCYVVFKVGLAVSLPAFGPLFGL